MIATQKTHEKPRRARLGAGRGCVRRLVPGLVVDAPPGDGLPLARRQVAAAHAAGLFRELVESPAIPAHGERPEAGQLRLRLHDLRDQFVPLQGGAASLLAVLADGGGLGFGAGRAALTTKGGGSFGNIVAHGRSELDFPAVDGDELVVGDCELALEVFGGTDADGVTVVANFHPAMLDVALSVKDGGGGGEDGIGRSGHGSRWFAEASLPADGINLPSRLGYASGKSNYFAGGDFGPRNDKLTHSEPEAGGGTQEK